MDEPDVDKITLNSSTSTGENQVEDETIRKEKVDIENISLQEAKEKIEITDNTIKYTSLFMVRYFHPFG